MASSTLKTYPNITQSIGITAILIAVMISTVPIDLWLNRFANEEMSMFLYSILSMGISFCIINTMRKQHTNNSSFDLTIKNKWIIPFLIIGSSASILGIVAPIVMWIPIPEFLRNTVLSTGIQTTFLTFFIIAIVAPIFEELIFRGIILDGLLKRYTPITAIVVSSILFGIVHLNPWQFITGLAIGFFSGWVYYKTRSVLPSIIIHVSSNASVFLMSYITSKVDLSIYGGPVTKTICAIMILSTCIIYLHKKMRS